MTDDSMAPHAVARLRAARLARSSKPFLARGGVKGARCPACRLVPSHCMCALRTQLATRAGVCLLMGDIEALKPSNTGWLVADTVTDTFAFAWTRTEVDPGLVTLLADSQWQPYVVFPAEYAAPARVVPQLAAKALVAGAVPRPLFILLDGTWAEARKMFRKSPYLDRFPVLSLEPNQASNYQLRRSRRDDHFCTSEVAALCLQLADETRAATVLNAYLDIYSHHYLRAKQQLPVEPGGMAYLRWHESLQLAW